MNAREKLEAIRSLVGRHCLKPYLAETHTELAAHWLCDCGYVSGDGFIGSFWGEGNSAEEAIDNVWEKIINLKPGLYICPDSSDKRHVRWNGIMWKDV